MDACGNAALKFVGLKATDNRGHCNEHPARAANPVCRNVRKSWCDPFNQSLFARAFVVQFLSSRRPYARIPTKCPAHHTPPPPLSPNRFEARRSSRSPVGRLFTGRHPAPLREIAFPLGWYRHRHRLAHRQRRAAGLGDFQSPQKGSILPLHLCGTEIGWRRDGQATHPCGRAQAHVRRSHRP
jgi:hypothetical protein